MSIIISTPDGRVTEVGTSSQVEPPSSSSLETSTVGVTTTFEITVVTTDSRDGSDLTTLSRVDSTSVGQETTTFQTATSIDQSPNSSASPTQTQSSIDTPTSTQLSTASIVGIAIGSIVAIILIVLCLLFVLGFRIHRATWRRQGPPTEALEPSDDRPAAVSASGGLHGKAELPDADYTRRLERLHDGAKPELEGSGGRKSVWEFFSIRSLSKRGTRQVPTELGTEPPAPGPHELPGDDILKPNSEEPRDAGDAT